MVCKNCEPEPMAKPNLSTTINLEPLLALFENPKEVSIIDKKLVYYRGVWRLRVTVQYIEEGETVIDKLDLISNIS